MAMWLCAYVVPLPLSTYAMGEKWQNEIMQIGNCLGHFYGTYIQIIGLKTLGNYSHQFLV